MRLLAVAVLTCLSLAEGREVEQGLAAVRQRLQGHSVAQRRLSPLQHRATLVSGTLAETAAALDRSDGQDLGYLRRARVTPSPGAPGRVRVTGTSSPEGAPAGIWMLTW